MSTSWGNISQVRSNPQAAHAADTASNVGDVMRASHLATTL